MNVFYLAGAVAVGVGVALALRDSEGGEEWSGSGVADSGSGSLFEKVAYAVEGVALKMERVFTRRSLSNIDKIAPHIDWYRSHPQVQAFLRVIRQTESSQVDGSPADRSRSAYTLRQGGCRLPYVSDSENWRRIDSVCPGGRTTAQGAYQFTKMGWIDPSTRLGLTDFSPVNQEKAAVATIAYLNAIDEVMAGDIEGACKKCNGTLGGLVLPVPSTGWTSLPGGAEQLQTIQQAKDTFVRWNGKLK